MNIELFIVATEWKNGTPPTVSCFSDYESAKTVLDVVPMASRVTIHQRKNYVTEMVLLQENGIIKEWPLR